MFDYYPELFYKTKENKTEGITCFISEDGPQSCLGQMDTFPFAVRP